MTITLNGAKREFPGTLTLPALLEAVGLAGKPVALCSSSEGKFAGIRCINHLRAVLVRCQMEVITPECSASEADAAFAEDGQFRDARLHQSMERLCRTLMETSRMLSTRIEA